MKNRKTTLDEMLRRKALLVLSFLIVLLVLAVPYYQKMDISRLPQSGVLTLTIGSVVQPDRDVLTKTWVFDGVIDDSVIIDLAPFAVYGSNIMYYPISDIPFTFSVHTLGKQRGIFTVTGLRRAPTRLEVEWKIEN